MIKKIEPTDFNTITMRLASPEKIKEWSYGEVTKPETINYRTQRSERNGLFDERIFGPEKDYECYCGKYRRIRYKDIICEKCGVEVTRSIVRRERMGHIELATPVAHIWFLRGIPSRMGLLLGLSVTDLEKVVYFSGYIITKVNEADKQNIFREIDAEYKAKSKSLQSDEAKEKLKQSLSDAKKEVELIAPGKVLDEVAYHKFSLKYGGVFEAEIGAEAVYNIFKKLDLDALGKKLIAIQEEANSVERAKIQKQLNLIKMFRRSGVRPEWMFLKVIPIIPPALRPMVALDGGRHATSDINDLYRRVINRNNRLKKLMEIKAPDVIQRNEKRILQEAVDALIDNSITQASGAIGQAARRPLKSLSDALKGKQGRFRQNLLGKRVDYSGRSVIVVGPELKLSQCGLPKHMALELFRPFVISKLLERELAFNIRGAGKLIDEGIPEVWEILEKIIKDKRVLLNRAPTLHRLGIQAFQPILIEGNAIQVHPLVCTAFNADFDGDQMAVHVPLSVAAQDEARELMASNKNLLGPGNNEPITTPKQDIVLGVYWMTKMECSPKERKNLRYFASPNSAILAYDYRHVGMREKVLVLPTKKAKFAQFENTLFETTVGRLLFNAVLPEDFPFINKDVRNKDIREIVEDLIAKYGIDATPPILDKIKWLGFHYATKSGMSWGIDDVEVPKEKEMVVKEARVKIEAIESQYNDGLISSEELYRMSIEVWQETKARIEKYLQGSLDPEGSVMTMITSGARGSITNVSQMAGMTGLVVNPAGEIINLPIVPSYKEGLSPLEYFVTTHGARKGLADTALKTARAGYLTRKLVYVADSAIISEDDCGDTEGRLITSADFSALESGIMSHVRGRILLQDIKDRRGKTLYKKGELLYKSDARVIEGAGITEARVRTALACKTVGGLCQKCYGLDLARNTLVEIGEAVGVVAAQATGEPGTQLTMRTFHSGGVASAAGDITQGLPRVEEIFEKRIPKALATISDVAGTVLDIKNENGLRIITILADAGEKLPKKSGGSIDYEIILGRTIIVKKGDHVARGDFLTDGSADIGELFLLAGQEKTEKYIIKEIHKIYEMQGAAISRKHFEVVTRQMFSRRRVKESGDTMLVAGEIVDDVRLSEENKVAVKNGGKKAVTEQMILGISDVALSTSSFLAAASFENTQRVLTDVAVGGGSDLLRGIKENVIIGRLIPAGTGIPAKERARLAEISRIAIADSVPD